MRKPCNDLRQYIHDNVMDNSFQIDQCLTGSNPLCQECHGEQICKERETQNVRELNVSIFLECKHTGYSIIREYPEKWGPIAKLDKAIDGLAESFSLVSINGKWRRRK